MELSSRDLRALTAALRENDDGFEQPVEEVRTSNERLVMVIDHHVFT
jgi:hypothetical protein